MTDNFSKIRADMEREKTRKYLLEKDIITDKSKKEVREWECFHCKLFKGSLEEVQEHQSNCRENI